MITNQDIMIIEINENEENESNSIGETDVIDMTDFNHELVTPLFIESNKINTTPLYVVESIIFKNPTPPPQIG